MMTTLASFTYARNLAAAAQSGDTAAQVRLDLLNRQEDAIRLQRKASARREEPSVRGQTSIGALTHQEWLAKQTIVAGRPRRNALLREMVKAEVAKEATREPACIDLTGDIDPAGPISLPIIQRIMSGVRPFQRIEAKLQSNGGCPLEALHIAQIIAAHRGESSVHVGKLADSAAITLLAAFGHRTCSSTARFQMHNTAAKLPNRLTAPAARRVIPGLERVDRETIEFIASAISTPTATLQAACDRDECLTAARAVELRLIHAIL